MYIPFWLLFTMVMWTWLAVELCRDEAYAAGVERRAPDYRSCWSGASIVMGAFVAAGAAILVVTPFAVMALGSIVDVAHRII